MNPRKGLKRYGLRAYIVQGPERAILIERERPSVYRVRPFDMPTAFDFGQYRRLTLARKYAEELAAIDTWPDPRMPVFLRRTS